MRKVLLFLPLVMVLFFSCASKDDGVVMNLTEAKNAAVTSMDRAKAIKADVAAKAQFDQAMAAYNDAEAAAAEATEKEPVLVQKYVQAQELFNAAWEVANTKRVEAQRQLDKAKADIQKVENDAQALEQQQATDGGSR